MNDGGGASKLAMGVQKLTHGVRNWEGLLNSYALKKAVEALKGE